MNFIDAQLQNTAPYVTSLNTTLIVISIIIAITSAFTAFGIIERINAAENKPAKIGWIITGAMSMGLGIWAMHFIGSLALKLPVPVTYNLNLTLLSMLPAVLVSCSVLWLMMHAKFHRGRLLLCGTILGLGICNMHFIGMLAMEFKGDVYFTPQLFIISAIVAILFATTALYIQFHSVHAEDQQVVGIKQLKGAVTLGFAVSGVYYLATQATVFIPGTGPHLYTSEIDATVLAYIISIVVLLILLLAIITPQALLFRQISFTAKHQQENSQIAATAFQSNDAIVITDADARVIRVNAAYLRSTGYDAEEVIGKNLDTLFNLLPQDETLFAQNMQQLKTAGQWNGEVSTKCKQGKANDVWAAISAVKDPEHEITHFVASFSDISVIKKVQEEVARLAYFDPLTNLPNRRILNEKLSHELAIAKRYCRIGALLFIDLDRFKHINDSLGHAVGDAILKETSRRLLLNLRESDTAIRLGGDEFLVLIPAQDRPSAGMRVEAQAVAEKLLAEINRPYFCDKHRLSITPSIGISLFSGAEEGIDSILKQADRAMYQAKDAGRNTYRFFRSSMQEAVDVRCIMEKHLRQACANDEFTMYLQAQYSHTFEIIGVEALIRWQHPELGLLSPDKFLAIAEDTGLIAEIDLWMLQTACRQLQEFNQAGIYLPYIAVNVSPNQFYQADFVSKIKQVVDAEKIQHERILLEITEGCFLQNIEEAKAKMNALTHTGFRFSIDDFGTGYSSLSYLTCLPFEQLKIAQTFVRSLLNDEKDAEIIRAIIAMAKAMGLNPIAEGVESEEHFKYLSLHGCEFFQGHFFCKPLPVDEFSTYYLKHLETRTIS